MGPPLDPIAPLRDVLRRRYEFEREIGQGAFATVYLARDLKHERKVAIKVLHADPSSETGELRFIREIRLLARLQHPNILPLHDSGHVETLLYYVMPYVSGETLRDRINRERQLPVETACNIARDIADALAYAHAEGIIHRDIKPENVLLSAGHPILADFGIARVIDLAGVRQVTQTGMGSPGTPAYMSPEQLMGDKALDGRSDTYSLGCVLFEMLTGRPPFAGKEGFVKRFTESPPSARALRPDMPLWVDDALARALAREASDRYGAASEFAAALHPPSSSGDIQRANRSNDDRNELAAAVVRAAAARSPVMNDVPAPTMWTLPGATSVAVGARPKRDWLVTNRRQMLITASAVLLSAIAFLTASKSQTVRNFFGAAQLDTARFVVLPPTVDPNVSNADVQSLGDRMYESFRAWNGLNLATDLEVNEATRGRNAAPSTLSEAMDVARRVHAGRMIWGRILSGGTNPKLRAELYDVVRNTSTGRFAVIGANASATQVSQAMLALVAVPNRPRAATDGDGLTTSFPAWTDYNLGQVALSSWDLSTAERKFNDALASDPNLTVANLWLAQIRAWRDPDKPAEWQDGAMRAAADSRGLPASDSIIARALIDLGAKRYPSACSRYSELTRRDSLSFIGWYGLGECQALDSLVVPSTTSPSGWAFRSDNSKAADAYMLALRREPRAHVIFPFERLTRLLPVAASKPRVGRSSEQGSELFAASPSLVRPGESLVFIPYPQSQFAALPVGAISTLNAALERNADLLADFTTDWTRQSPNDPAAFEALGDILDNRGEIQDDRPGRMSALGAIARARALSTDKGQKLRTATKEVWIRFKRGEFKASRALADSILQSNQAPTEADARILIGLAAVTGKISRTADLARETGWYLRGVRSRTPDGVSAPAARLFATSALGICDTALLRSLRRDLDNAIDSYVQPQDAESLREDLLERPRIMMAPCTQGKSALEIKAPRSRLIRMQQAFGRRDFRSLRAILDTVSRVSQAQRPGDLSPDYVFQQACLRVALGDTVAAIRQLDRTLDGLSGVSTATLQEPGAAAGIVRAMILRADLARAQKDQAPATKWRAAVAAIWDRADPELRKTLAKTELPEAGRPD